MKKSLSTIFMLFVSTTFAANVEQEIKALSALMVDQQATLVHKSINVEQNEKDLLIATFSLEGFKGGNNTQQYVVAFKAEFKTLDQPPFTKVGPAKYRMIGVRQLCSSPTEYYQANSLQLNNKQISGVCQPQKGASKKDNKFTLDIGTFDIH